MKKALGHEMEVGEIPPASTGTAAFVPEANTARALAMPVLSRSAPQFIVEVAEAMRPETGPDRFTITPEGLSNVSPESLASMPRFKVAGAGRKGDLE